MYDVVCAVPPLLPACLFIPMMTSKQSDHYYPYTLDF